MTSGNTVSYST